MKKIFYSSLLLSILWSILFLHKNLGISVILFIVPTLLLIIYNLKEKEMLINKKGLIWVIPIILISSTYFIFNNTFFKIINVPVLFALITIMCIDITGEKLSENKFIRKILGKIFNPILVLFDIIGDFQIDNFIEKSKENKNEKIELAKKIGKALLISIPIVIIIILLLSSADSVFGSIFGDVSKLISNIFSSKGISEIISRLIWIIVVFIYISGFIITFVKQRNKEELEENEIKKLSNFTINTLLILLDFIYLLFSIIQFKYLFISAGKTADFDYATYARTGFFQLMFVSFINFILIKKSKYIKDEKFNKTLKILLILFTIIIVISAMFRMHLYEQAYGYTYLRLFVYFILTTEILILVPILINICGKELDVFSICLKIIILMYVILNFINIDYIIVKNNIDRYLTDMENKTIDVYYIVRSTGTDALSEWFRILNQNDKNLSYEKKEYLNNAKVRINQELKYYKIKYKNNKSSWQEWNLSEYRAKKMLKNFEY